MNRYRNETVLTTGLGVREYFQDAVQTALINQRFTASEESVIYIANLLTAYIRTERLFEHTPDGFQIKPLALIYGEALTAASETGRTRSMRRLGDVALFISGLFANSLERCLVDVDYYISMGGNAYGYLAGKPGIGRKHVGLKIVFDELSEKFVGFVEILAEVSESSNINGNMDILRMYEIWQCTGSKRAARKLRELGIQPIKIQRRPH